MRNRNVIVMRICLLTAFHASWTEQEVSILKELGHVVYLLYPDKYTSKRLFNISIVGNFYAYVKLFLMNMQVLLRSDLIYCWFVFPPGVFAMIFGRLFRKPVILTAIGFDVALVPAIKYGVPSKLYYRPFVSWALKNATRVMAISKDVALWAEKWGGKNVKVVYEGIDVQKFRPLEIEQSEKKDYVLLAVSVLDKLNVKRKDFESLLFSLPHVLSAFPNAKLVIVGRKGSGYSTLKRMVRKLKIEGNVVFKGSVSDSELIELYNTCDIFVSPSLHEGFPTVCAEAQSCGKPVVATNVASIPEVIKNNENGILVRFRDPEALASAIKELLSDSVLRKKMGSVGRRRIIQLFSKEIRKKKLQAILATF